MFAADARAKLLRRSAAGENTSRFLVESVLPTTSDVVHIIGRQVVPVSGLRDHPGVRGRATKLEKRTPRCPGAGCLVLTRS